MLEKKLLHGEELQEAAEIFGTLDHYWNLYYVHNIRTNGVVTTLKLYAEKYHTLTGEFFRHTAPSSYVGEEGIPKGRRE